MHGCKYDVLRESGSPGRKRKVWMHAINGISLGFTRTVCFVMVFDHFVSCLPSHFSHSLRYRVWLYFVCAYCLPILLLVFPAYKPRIRTSCHSTSSFRGLKKPWLSRNIAWPTCVLIVFLWECVCMCIVRSEFTAKERVEVDLVFEWNSFLLATWTNQGTSESKHIKLNAEIQLAVGFHIFAQNSLQAVIKGKM